MAAMKRIALVPLFCLPACAWNEDQRLPPTPPPVAPVYAPRPIKKDPTIERVDRTIAETKDQIERTEAEYAAPQYQIMPKHKVMGMAVSAETRKGEVVAFYGKVFLAREMGEFLWLEIDVEDPLDTSPVDRSPGYIEVYLPRPYDIAAGPEGEVLVANGSRCRVMGQLAGEAEVTTRVGWKDHRAIVIASALACGNQGVRTIYVRREADAQERAQSWAEGTLFTP